MGHLMLLLLLVRAWLERLKKLLLERLLLVLLRWQGGTSTLAAYLGRKGEEEIRVGTRLTTDKTSPRTTQPPPPPPNLPLPGGPVPGGGADMMMLAVNKGLLAGSRDVDVRERRLQQHEIAASTPKMGGDGEEERPVSGMRLHSCE